MAYVPQIKGLRVAELLEEAKKHVNIDDYLPDMKDEKLPNRDFVVNVGKGDELMHSEHLDPSWTSKNGWTSEKWKRRKIHKEKELVNEGSSRVSENIHRYKRSIK